MDKKLKKIVLTTASIIGFISAVVGLWAYFYTPTPDSEIWLLPKETPNIQLTTSNLPDTNIAIIKANILTIDGTRVALPNGSMLLANQIKLQNGAEIFGDSIAIIATQIEGGRVSSTRARLGHDGGDLFIAVAIINGTAIESNGASGKNGRNGTDGSNGATGANGQNGKCGAGGWRKAKPGGQGGNGGNGGVGEDGERGGDAGSIVILTSYEPTVLPIAGGGNGGRGGQGGSAGHGGPGGRGGAGCTGLGGSQSSRASGASGTDGRPGNDGRDGPNGQNRNPTIKLIDFAQVKEAVDTNAGIKSNILSVIRAIRPKNR